MGRDEIAEEGEGDDHSAHEAGGGDGNGASEVGAESFSSGGDENGPVSGSDSGDEHEPIESGAVFGEEYCGDGDGHEGEGDQERLLAGFKDLRESAEDDVADSEADCADHDCVGDGDLVGDAEGGLEFFGECHEHCGEEPDGGAVENGGEVAGGSLLGFEESEEIAALDVRLVFEFFEEAGFEDTDSEKEEGDSHTATDPVAGLPVE